jgi:hypothetical protein
MNERPDDALTAHARECDECGGNAAALAQARALLDAAAVPVDVTGWSRPVLARVAPELQTRARAAFWRRLARTLGAALVPLPLLVVADVWMLGRLYDLAASWLPSGLAAYLVLSYAASLLVLIGSVYAAIPLLLARPTSEPDGAPA